jgi:hypothetical protein
MAEINPLATVPYPRLKNKAENDANLYCPQPPFELICSIFPSHNSPSSRIQKRVVEYRTVGFQGLAQIFLRNLEAPDFLILNVLAVNE